MDSKLLDKVINCPRLPSLPSVALDVIELCRDDNVKIEEIAKTISNDPALSCKILKTVNSSYYGLRKSITTISHAIVILGLNAVKTLALSFSLVNTFKNGTGEDYDPMKFWRRVLYSATGARTITEHLKMEESEEVFLGALLQDLGVMAMMQQLKQPYIDLIMQTENNHDGLSKLERKVFDLTHFEVGATMAENWKLPPILVEPIRYHESPEISSKEYRQLVRVVALGNMVAPVFLSESPTYALTAFLTEARKSLKISEANAEKILSRIDEVAKELGKFFEIDRNGANEIGEILLEANEVMQEISMKAHEDSKKVEEDKARLEAENKNLEEKSITDALTGLKNRGHFNDKLSFYFDHAHRQTQPVSLILFDLDKFKLVNDTHGHLAGDKVLIDHAKVVSETVAECGLVARYGGEEFGVILPGLDRKEAAVLAEKIRNALENAPIEIEKELTLTVTASIGVACFDGVSVFKKPEQLIKAADQAVYAAKSSGRNCVRVFAPRAKKAS